jgi:hypothetical protein
MTEMRNIYNILVSEPEGKRPLSRPKYRWEDNIRMDLRVTRSESVEWMHMAQDRNQWQALVNSVMNFWVP